MPLELDPEFPCSLLLQVPFPTDRLASHALRALQVDKELSPLVRRQLSVEPPESLSTNSPPAEEEKLPKILRIEYRATTNRMLRVSVNSFIDSLKLVLEVMEQLDVDVLALEGGQETRPL